MSFVERVMRPCLILVVGCGSAAQSQMCPEPVMCVDESMPKAVKSTPAGRFAEDDSEPELPVPKELQEKLALARTSMHSGEKDTAAKALADADELAGDEFAWKVEVAWTRAAAFAYARDFERSAAVFRDLLVEAEQRPAEPTAFWFHNTLMMLRQAQGDVASALVENDEATRVGESGTWSPDGELTREKQVAMKEQWHRAYLLRMLAEQLEGTRRVRTLEYAQEAKARYTNLALDEAGYADSVAVLDAYFAALDGDAPAALAAAKRVDVEKNGDAEDLYLAHGAFLAGGDLESAKRVLEKLENPAFVYVAVPIMLYWAKNDREALKNSARARFSPFHPTAPISRR